MCCLRWQCKLNELPSEISRDTIRDSICPKVYQSKVCETERATVSEWSLSYRTLENIYVANIGIVVDHDAYNQRMHITKICPPPPFVQKRHLLGNLKQNCN